MPQLDINASPNVGDTFTLAFQPTGIGNPFDSATDWYNVGADYANVFTVTNVNMSGGLLTAGEIDVTINMLFQTPPLTYAEIGELFTTALSGTLYGYTFIGAISGQGTLSATSSGSVSSIAETLAIAAVAIAIAAIVFKKEVL